MDLRNQIIEKEKNDNILALSTNVTGAASKVVDDNTLQSKSKAILDDSIQKNSIKLFDINNYQLNDVLHCINVYYENIKDVDIPFYI
ncbi:MAG: hypothetical protein L6V88_05200 [Anaerotruncus sp.]|nr:MAG: hypothetical protein L6V88_05200 [Anaerotruncus sp.]